MSVDRGETRVALLESTEAPAGNGTQNAAEGTSSGRRRRRGRGGGGGGGGNASGNGGGRRPGAAGSDYRVAELYFERRSNRSIVGNVYKGRVDNVLPGLEAAFIDIGLEKNAFLHVDEIRLPGVKVVRRGHGGSDQPKIGDLIKPGDELVVQVTKDPLKTKGARVTMDLTIAGRYLVYAPKGEGIGVSKKVDDAERNRLRKEVKDIELAGGGAIVRTAARGAVREDFERELPYLFKLHEVLEQRAQEMSGPCMVFQEADLSVRVVRDIFSSEFERAIVDDPAQVQRLKSFFTRTAPELVDKVELWEESEPLFDSFAVEEVIDGLLGRRVDLPSGGYLMIDYGEALTVIDVNSGSYTGKGKQARLEDTITRTNLEAAEAVVNELRLRDIGGIIVIDFIDMARQRNQRDVLKKLREKLGEDRTKTFTAEISKLGLVEMTRQNVTEGAREVITRACPTCDGDGVIKSEETLAIEFERRLRELASRAPAESEAFLVRMHPGVVAEFTGQSARVLHQLESTTGRYFVFEGSERLPLDEFEIVMEGPIDEVKERAIPFQEGEEVLVQIVEPHMYNVDDAVAKVGGYVVSVTGGGRFVGEKKLVRIERAGRTSASAALLGADALPAAPEPGTEPAPTATAAKSRSRGRGRGRGRGGAAADRAAENGADDAVESDADEVRDADAGRGGHAGRDEAAGEAPEVDAVVAEPDAVESDATRAESAGSDVVDALAEPADEPAPPKRRRSRRKPAASAGTTTDDAEGGSEGVSGRGAADAADPVVDDEPAAPKRTRTRRRAADLVESALETAVDAVEAVVEVAAGGSSG
ncbi:MAG: Rne/Rng family ribonuclease, partial [Patulibacter sp.]